MKQVPLNAHTFTKTNLVTIIKGNRIFDEYKCSTCGMIGRRYGLSEYAEVSNKYSDKLVNNCLAPEIDIWVGKPIKVIKCSAGGGAFKNLTPNSIHIVVSPPDNYINAIGKIWVQGIGEPVALLSGEFVFIEMKRRKFNKS